MKVIRGKGKIKLSIICSIHGDEPFGRRVFDYYKTRMDQLEGVQFILANEKALERGVRFVDTDLNRCFPGRQEGNEEELLAHEILKLTENSEYVVDIHSTTSDIAMTPIVSNLGEGVKRILNLCDSFEVAHMSQMLAKGSFIGSVRAGVSLEFEEKYAETDEALGQVVTTIDALAKGIARSKSVRKVFLIDRKIPLQLKLPRSATNFVFIKSLGIHPFLLGDRAYTDFQGFAASRVKRIKI